MPRSSDHDPFGAADVSYSVRRLPETPRDVLVNRLGVTASLFTAAIGLSYALGRKRT